MKNLQPYQESCFEFHKEVIDSKNTTKKDPEFKERVRSLNNLIEDRFNEYDDLFDSNQLEGLSDSTIAEGQKNDLSKLYSYKNSVIQKLRISLTTSASGVRNNTCQNCTINEVDSMDHYVPKEEHTEFIVNPKNLIPSCTQCNRIKTRNWLEDGERFFINLYSDELPDSQYLYVEINIEEGVVIPSFYLENPGNIGENLYAIIYNHYENLKLLKRFSLSSDTIVTELINTIKSCSEYLNRNQIKAVVRESCQNDLKAFGRNHWKSILKISLVNNDDFLDQFSQEN